MSYMFGSVVDEAVGPDQIDIREEEFNSRVLSAAEFRCNCCEVHRMLYYLRVVVKTLALPIYRVDKI